MPKEEKSSKEDLEYSSHPSTLPAVDSEMESTSPAPICNQRVIRLSDGRLLPYGICELIVSFSDARSLLGLQYLSSGFYFACNAEAKARLDRQMSDTAPVKALYCRDFKKCIQCGLKLCKDYHPLAGTPLCPCCFDGRILIPGTVAKEHFYVEDSDLKTIPVTVRPNQGSKGTVSFYWLDGVRKLAYLKYGKRSGSSSFPICITPLKLSPSSCRSAWLTAAREKERLVTLKEKHSHETPLPAELRTEPPVAFPLEICWAIASFTKTSDLYGLRCINRNFRAAVEEEVASRCVKERVPLNGIPPVVYLYRKDAALCLTCGLPRCLDGSMNTFRFSSECPACYRDNFQISASVAKDHFHVEDSDLERIKEAVKKRGWHDRSQSLYWLSHVKKLAFSKHRGRRAWLSFAREKEALGNTWRHAHQIERRARITRLISSKRLGVQDVSRLENSKSYKDYILSGIPRSESDLSVTVDRLVAELQGRKSYKDARRAHKGYRLG